VVDVQTVSIVIASASVVVGIVYYSFQIRHQTKARQTDSYWRIQASFNSREYLEAFDRVSSLEFKDYNDFTEKYGDLLSGKSKVFVPFNIVCDLFEAIGYLLHNGLIEYDIANQFPVIRTWERVKPIVEGFRKKTNDPRDYEWFEYLYNEVKKREQKLQSKT
jgi:hypothetical protein